MEKECSRCQTSKDVIEFRSHRGHRDGHYSICRQCEKEEWWQLRKEVFLHYGGYVCVVCGETDPARLQIDHIDNTGKQHRAEGRQAARKIIKWLKDNNYPSGFQVLCGWCNLVKAICNGSEIGTDEWKRKVRTLTAFLGTEDDLIEELRRIKPSS